MMSEDCDNVDWRGVAAALARQFSRERLDAEAVRELPAALPARNTAAAGNFTACAGAAAGVAVACSGGGDSVAAALLVWALFPEAREGLALLHFNHRTRVECAAEAEFVRELAQGLGVRFVCGEWDDDAASSARAAESGTGGSPVLRAADAGMAAAMAMTAAGTEDCGLGARCCNTGGTPAPFSAVAAAAVNAGASEAELRAARLRFFRETCARLGLRWVVQGHHADDVVENVLMRLGRGSGTAGLAAPRPVQRFGAAAAGAGLVFVRPLLTLRKAEILAALLAAGGRWCEDASNAGGAHLRNRIRHGVAPAWEQAQGACVAAGVARSRRLLAEDAAALEAWADELWARAASPACVPSSDEISNIPHPIPAAAQSPSASASGVDWRVLAEAPAAVHRRVFWRALVAMATHVTPTAAVVDAIVAALAKGGAFRRRVAAGVDLVFDGETLRVERRDAAAGTRGETTVKRPVPCDAGGGVLRAGGCLFWAGRGWLEAARVTLDAAGFTALLVGKVPPTERVFLADVADADANGSGGLVAGVSPSAARTTGGLPAPFSAAEAAAAAGFRVRGWRAGDAYRPLGAPGGRNLSDVFIDRKIPAEARHLLPLICDAKTGAVLWVPGLPPAHERRLRMPGACVRLTWHPAAAPSVTPASIAATAPA